jgi:fermentation-respiration switch protein FrsA (DUF1100 family)
VIATLAYPYVVELSAPMKVDPAKPTPVRIVSGKRPMQVPLEVS